MNKSGKFSRRILLAGFSGRLFQRIYLAGFHGQYIKRVLKKSKAKKREVNCVYSVDL